jgi:hypothetical protein
MSLEGQRVIRITNIRPLLRNNRVTVARLQPVVCKMCWGRKAVNSVRIGAVEESEGTPMCQPCSNLVITQFSERHNGERFMRGLNGGSE